MAPGKWIDNITPAQTVAEALPIIIDTRLPVVEEFLAKASLQPEEDVEHVHQLRVGTRRMAAVLRAFSDMLQSKAVAKTRRMLKKIRQAAGDARDWDVFLLSCQTDSPLMDFLRGYGLVERSHAQELLIKANEQFHSSFANVSKQLHKAVKTKQAKKEALLERAKEILTQHLNDLLDAGQCDWHNAQQMHQVRIVGKHLRYNMEIFAKCFAEDFVTVHYRSIEELQDILGAMNDHAVALQRFRGIQEVMKHYLPSTYVERYGEEWEQTIAQHHDAMANDTDNFSQWWRQWQESGGRAAMQVMLE